MCILLYMGIARGPIAVVAPIVAAHPALVLAVNVLMGMRPSAMQWAAMVAVMAGGILIARSAVAETGRVRSREQSDHGAHRLRRLSRLRRHRSDGSSGNAADR